MKKLTRIVSAVLTAAMLSSVALCAPFTVSAAETDGNSVSYESNVEFQMESVAETKVKETEYVTGNNYETESVAEPTESQAGIKQIKQNMLGASYTVNGFTYEVVDKKAKITKYNDSSVTSITIPEKLGGYTVTEIGEGVFRNYSNLASVSIPDTVEIVGYEAFKGTPWYNNQPDGLVYIGKIAYKYKSKDSMPVNTKIALNSDTVSVTKYAFYQCSNLTEIVFNEGLEYIGYGAFESCSALQKIKIPDTVTEIRPYAFYRCVSLDKLTLSENLTVLGGNAFRECTALISVTIPKSLTTVDGEAPFNSCENLTEIVFESGMEKIPNYIAKYCTGLQTISIPDSVSVIGDGAFERCSALQKIKIPDTVTEIRPYAFYRCVSLNELTLSENLTVLGGKAFLECTALTSVIIPQSLTTVDGEAPFNSCENLTEIVFESGMEKIPNYIAKYCTGLQTISIPDSVSVIGDGAFERCSALQKIKIPDTVTEIRPYAFYRCVSLDELILSENLTVLGGKAFLECTALTSVTIPKSLTTVDGEAPFRACENLTEIIIESGMTAIPQRLAQYCTGLKNVSIPNTVTDIGDGAFEYCSSLESIDIPDSVTKIGRYAFQHDVSLTNIALSENLAIFDEKAFCDCTNLTRIILPDSVTSIGEHAFENCISVTEIKLSSNLEKIGGGAFINTNIESISIPKTLKTINTTYYNSGYRGPFYGCENLKNVTFEDGMETIPANLFKGGKNGIESITMPDSVTSIGEYAFENCTSVTEIKLSSNLEKIGGGALINTNIESVSIPKTLKTINTTYYNSGYRGPFYGCENLKNVTFEDGMETIPANLFKGGKNSIESITMPDSVTSIGEYAFNGCTALKELTTPSNLRTIYPCAFSDCTALESIELNDGLNVIGYSAFSKTAVKEIKIPKSTWMLNFERYSKDDESSAYYNSGSGASAFYGAENLEKVVFEEGAYLVSGYGFYKCKNLKEVILPDSILAIRDYAFADCENLKRINVPESANTIENNAFKNCNNLIGYCPKYSKAMINFIDKGITAVSNNEKRITPSGALIDTECYYEAKSSKGVSFVCNYSINEDVFGKLSNTSIKIRIPEGTAIATGSLYLDKELCENYTESDTYISIPVKNRTGKITFNLDVTGDYNFRTYAIFNYRLDGKSQYDIIDVINDDIPIISVSTDSVTSTEIIKINGAAPVSSDVKVYVDDEYVATLSSNRVGSYRGNITLPNAKSDTAYKIKVETLNSDGNTIFAETNTYYQEKAPKLTGFTMKYNGRTYNLLDNKKQSVTFILESFHGGTPFEFAVNYENYENIDYVIVASTRNQAVKTMKAKWDETRKAFVAKGYFDENNHDYVPGKISVYYQNKINDTVDIDWVNAQLNSELPEELKNATNKIVSDTEDKKEMLITLTTGDKITYSYERFTPDEFFSIYNPEKSQLNINNLKSGNMLGAVDTEIVGIVEKLISYGWNLYTIGENSTKTYVNTEESDDSISYYYYDEVSNYFKKEMIKETTKGSLKAFYSIVADEQTASMGMSVGGFVYDEASEYINYFNSAIEYENAKASVMMDGTLSESQKQAKIAQLDELKQKSRDLACAKMLGTYMKYAGGLVLAECPPLGIALWAGGFLIKDVYAKHSDWFDEKAMKIQSFFNNPFIWSIDPSGYVYAGVTNNRLSDVKVTAYWIPFDEENEAFWDAPDESKAQLWDADEYSQYNPLYTDATGNYAWDVPEGWWKVVCEKDGYETYTSEWMQVPPPQTDININLMSKEMPVVENAEMENGEITLEFSIYMNPETMNNITVTDSKGNVIDYTLKYSEEETDTNGTVYADTFVLVLDGNYNPNVKETYTITINDAESYAGVKNRELTAVVKNEPVITALIGDVNGDGSVTVLDATLLQKYLAGLVSFSDEQLAVADTNGDGSVTVLDATAIQKYLANLITSLG